MVAEPWIDSLMEKLCEMMGLPPPTEENKAINFIASVKKEKQDCVPPEQSSESSLSEMVAANLVITDEGRGDASNVSIKQSMTDESIPAINGRIATHPQSDNGKCMVGLCVETKTP